MAFCLKTFRSSLKLGFILFIIINFNAISQSNPNKIKVLIVDGFNNHNWEQTSFIVKTILEDSKLFHVDISTCPITQENLLQNSWNPRFKKYDVVIQNTNNINQENIKWPTKIQKRLEKYVNKGGGLYILHSANNAFKNWNAYNLMIGLGWRNPDEGMAIQIKDDGGLLKIPVNEGKATYHGPRNDEIIQILNNHPINKGFPNAWKTPDMELYKFARGPAKNLTVLSYAKDEKTNINWPVEWIVAFGKGRIYNSSMGHLWKGQTYPISFRCVGFQTTLIRATEWLATGQVSFEVPINFPTRYSISTFSE